MKTDIEIIPYGGILSALTKQCWRSVRHPPHSKSRTPQSPCRLFISSSRDLDEPFAELFRKCATQHTRLVILNEGKSTDWVLSRVVDLKIRSPQRFYVVDGVSPSCKARGALFGQFLHSLLKRLTSAHCTEEGDKRILDARIEEGVLRVISPNFERLDVSVTKIPQLKSAEMRKVQEFEIDEDGSFIYWPELDLHVGWSQLQQIVDPQAAFKASAKSAQFNHRYGKAVKKLRERAGLTRTDISGLSEKQLRRIEKGECRLTSNAIRALSQTHNLAANEYMKKLAEVLE